MVNRERYGKSSGTAAPYELLIVTDTFEEFLEGIAELAIQELGADLSCEITAHTDHQYMSATKRAARIGQSDATHHVAEFGPIRHVLDTGEVVQIDDFSNDDRWDTRCAGAYGYGLRSSLTLPIGTGGRIVGTLNLYSRQPHRFASDLRRRAAQFADQTAGALTLATRICAHRRRNEHLQRALDSRAVIDQAIGVVMAQKRCTPREAFGVLCAASQNHNSNSGLLPPTSSTPSIHARWGHPGPLPRAIPDATAIDPPDRHDHDRSSGPADIPSPVIDTALT